MTETTTFQDKNKKITVTVKKTFLEKCPTPENHTILELNKDFNMLTFLHNEVGPALTRKGIEDEYWIDGVLLNKSDPERMERIKHGVKFGVKLDEFINS